MLEAEYLELMFRYKNNLKFFFSAKRLSTILALKKGP